MASPPSTSYGAPAGRASQKRSRPVDLHASDVGPSSGLDFQHEDGEDDDDDDDAGDDGDKAPKKTDKKAGRRKIKIEFIQDKSRRHITFSKRKAGIMKKAYELSTLTGTQVLLLVVSETGLVYTFTTAKLQPLVTQPEGKNLIQACLNAPHGAIPSGVPAPNSVPSASPATRSATAARSNAVGGLAIGADEMDDEVGGLDDVANKPRQRRRTSSTTSAPGGLHSHSKRLSTGRSPPLSPTIPDHSSPDGPISPSHSPSLPSSLPPGRNYTTASANAGGATLSPSSTSSSLGGLGQGGAASDMYRATVGHPQHHHQAPHHHQPHQQQPQQQHMMYHPSYTTGAPQHNPGAAMGYPQQPPPGAAPQQPSGGSYWNTAPQQPQMHAHSGVHAGRR